MFFTITHGRNTKNTDRALPLMNLLNIMLVKSVHQLQALKFAFQMAQKGVGKQFSELFSVC